MGFAGVGRGWCLTLPAHGPPVSTTRKIGVRILSGFGREVDVEGGEVVFCGEGVVEEGGGDGVGVGVVK